MGADQQNPVSPGRYLFEDAPPAPAHLAALARPFVDRAKLNYRNFRVELERIGGLAVKAMSDGLLGKEDATLIWLDVGDVLSTPLIARYCDARQYEPMLAWLRARPGFQCTGWVRGYALSAMERLVADGQGARAASLALAHVERTMKSLRLDWKERRRGIPKKLAPDAQAALRSTQAALIARIPVRNAEMLMEIGEMLPYLAHGTAEERVALEAFRREVLADQERFPAA